MPKMGNYIQRDYNTRSNRKSTWSDYNKAWSSRRSNALQKSQQLRNVAANFSTINVQSSQSTTAFFIQNIASSGPYANPTAVASRINVLV